MIHEKDKYLKINSKWSGDGGGSVGTFKGLAAPHSHTSPSYREQVYNAVYVILSNIEGDIEIHKNSRNEGRTGQVTGEEFLDVALKILAHKLYNGTSEVFQEAFIQDAKKRLRRVLKKHSKVERMAQ